MSVFLSPTAPPVVEEAKPGGKGAWNSSQVTSPENTQAPGVNRDKTKNPLKEGPAASQLRKEHTWDHITFLWIT